MDHVDNRTLALFAARKSVRAYEDRPVGPETREAVLAATLRAPTAGNLQLYTILEIEDPALKRRLSETCDHQAFIARAPWVLVFLADAQRLEDWLTFSAVDALCAASGEERKRPREGDLLLACSDALIAAHQCAIAAESVGLGSCYIGDVMENWEIHRELLGLPRLAFPIAMLTLGWPSAQQEARPLTSRAPADLVVHRDRYRELDADGAARLFARPEYEGLKYLEGCSNYGQHMYRRKLASGFMDEMRRSVAAMLENWKG